MPEIIRYDDVQGFYSDVESFLLADEAAHNLQLGVLNTYIEHPERFVEREPYFALVREAGEVVGMVMQSPPYNLDFSLFSIEGDLLAEAVAGVVHDYHAADRPLPGVHGPPEVLPLFLPVWESLTGQHFQRDFDQRIYRLDAVIMPQDVSGYLRRATLADLDLLVEWNLNFSREIFGTDPDIEQAREGVRFMLSFDVAGRGLHVWEVDGEVVSSANATGPTPHGMRINFVYTPPDQRRKGYASAVTAALSQAVLDSGRDFCALFTDLTNPTSNHIYQQIGYRSVVDIHTYKTLSD